MVPTSCLVLILSLYSSSLQAYGPPLVEAAAHNDLNQVQRLLEQGEEPNLAGFDGTTALAHAIRHRNKSMILSLFDKGADIQSMDQQHLPAIVGGIPDPKIVALFLDHGLSADISDNNGQTLLMHASHNGSTEVIQLLLSRGANLKTTDKAGMTPLHHAIAGYGRSATVSKLLSSGAQVNSAQSDGTTPMMDASRIGRTDFIRLLALKGAQINVQNERGETALMLAIQKGHAMAVQALLSYGASVTATRKIDGATALSMAKNIGATQIIDLLRSAGAQQ